MLIVGHTPGGAPYGPPETAEDHLIDCLPGPGFLPVGGDPEPLGVVDYQCA